MILVWSLITTKRGNKASKFLTHRNICINPSLSKSFIFFNIINEYDHLFWLYIYFSNKITKQTNQKKKKTHKKKSRDIDKYLVYSAGKNPFDRAVVEFQSVEIITASLLTGYNFNLPSLAITIFRHLSCVVEYPFW